MGRKNSAAAKARRTAEQNAEREEQKRKILQQVAYCKTRLQYKASELEEIRLQVRQAMPMLQESMAARAVSVLCLSVGEYFSDEHNNRVVDEFVPELMAHLEESGFAIDSFTEHPINMIGEAIQECIERYEATTQNSSGAAGLAPSQEVVLLAATGSQAKGAAVGPIAQGQSAQAPRTHKEVGPSVQGPWAQRHKGTLGLDLGGRHGLSKPRSLKHIDELMWAAAQQLAIKEVATQCDIEGECEQYHNTMCKVGQICLAEVIHVKTQAIYDARSTQKLKRESRKFK